MEFEELVQDVAKPEGGKIVLVVLDGLGGLPSPELGGRTELEAAVKPNMDALARNSSLGLSEPVLPGITPGSGAGHLGLFGYDPLKYIIGRGVLEALGIGFDLQTNDVAARANFATAILQDQNTVIVDRRAGRPPTSETVRLCRNLQSAISEIDGVQVLIKPVKEHRFVVVFRGEGLGADVEDTDPQTDGLPPLPPKPRNADSERTAVIAQKFIERAADVLKGEPKANFALLRGFAKKPDWILFPQLFKVKAGAVAVYPMYRGLAALVGMTVIQFEGESIADEIEALKTHWDEFDFFFFHVKATDSRGEDGDALGKVKVIEAFDKELPKLLQLQPDVLAITGDHSTPSTFKAHSWHPVPLLLHSKWVIPMPDALRFDERNCVRGSLGRIQAKYLMPLMLAHAGRLEKFSA